MLKKQSVTEQVASHLREELKHQRWKGNMPGRDTLARELGVHGSTVERALQELEKEGLVKKAGHGKPRLIVATGRRPAKVPTVCVLLYDAADEPDDYILRLQSQLGAAGHLMNFAPRTMRDLKFDPDRIEAMIQKQSADAWIVYCGSQRILERFVDLSIPAFALFGRMGGLPIAGAGTDILAALRETIHCLHGLGHSRIVMLTRSQLVETGLGITERTFVRELKEHHLPVSTYNLVAWDNSPAGLKDCLDQLFAVTPPTALFVDDWMIYNAVQYYLSHRQGVDHRKIHCISMEYHPSFCWYQPQSLHFYWNPITVVKAAVAWVKNVGRGRNTVAQKLIKAEFRGREVLTKLG